MNYMGSKRMMLENGLGKAIEAEIPQSKRFFDLFTGSGIVAWFPCAHARIEAAPGFESA
jgi:adenine-specific DNA methylase